MSQLSTVRLFFSANPCSPLFPLRIAFSANRKTLLKPSSLVGVFSASARRERRDFAQRRRSVTTLREPKGKEKPREMEAKESVGFNKRRAEGRDNSKPKNLQLKTRKLNPVNTICYVQILGTGMDTQDTSPSVLLFFDKQRFIFNAGEVCARIYLQEGLVTGLQRFCTEHKIKLSKIDHMFLTRVCSETAGGLPGLLLTLAGMGDEGMTVNMWGPSDLKYLVDAMRSFIPNAAMVHTHSFGSSPRASDADAFTGSIVLIDDEVVKISAILLRPSCSHALDLVAVTSEENRDHFSEPVASSLQSSLRKEVLKPGEISVIYVCELPEIKGKFDPAKAVALGLKAGPKYRELQLGNSVMSDHKNIIVHPSDVLGPSSPGPIVLLVDCPALSHLEEILSIQTLNGYYAENVDQHQDGMKSKTVNCVIHLGPASVTMTLEYQNWMKRFGGAQHIMAGHEMRNMEIPILKSSARIASRLSYLCPQIFPGPESWSLGHLNDITQNSAPSSEDSSLMLCDSIPAENLLKFQLRPYAQLGLDRSGVPNLVTRTEIVNELLAEIPEIEDASKHISQFWTSSGKSKEMASSTQDNVIMIEEPWINSNDCISNANLAKQATVGSEEIRTSNNSSSDDCKHELPPCLENISREDMEIVLLGTGSSQPSKYRNVSSIYINLFSKGSLLLDCGEGTLAQLKRRFGVKGADDAVRGLRFIWISHIHADHHTGLARILSVHHELLRDTPHEPLLVIGPRQLKRFLDAYSRLEDLDMQFLDCRYTTEASMESLADSLDSNGDYLPSTSTVGGQELFSAQKLEPTLFAKSSGMQSYWMRPRSPAESAMDLSAVMKLKKVLLEAGLEALISIPVVHCPQAFGVVLQAVERVNKVGKTIPGWKLAYSGDTRPCQALVDASRGATVLIHEATFEDGMVEEAVARNHSTTKEAIEVGASAGAYRIILTHFSQRYPKIPVFDESYMHKTCIAFDMMSINVADLPVLPKVLPYLTLLFRNEMVADESDDIPVSMQNA